MLRIELMGDQRDALGEGPLWDVEEERLYWIDSYGPAVFSCRADGGDRRRWAVPEPIGSLALRRGGGAVVALRSGFHLLDFETGEVTLIAATHPGELRPRLNDGKVDRQGRFLAGSMDFEERDGVGALFRLDPDLSVHVLDTGIVCSNGPCFSPDGGRSTSPTRAGGDLRLRLRHGHGSVRSRRVFASFERERGLPDGATVDAEGYVWSCEVYSGRLIRFDPSGVVDRVVGLPVQSTTSLTFGGPNLDIAYVTSMARPHQGAHHREREAGGLFAIHGLGVRGLPEPRFNG